MDAALKKNGKHRNKSNDFASSAFALQTEFQVGSSFMREHFDCNVCAYEIRVCGHTYDCDRVEFPSIMFEIRDFSQLSLYMGTRNFLANWISLFCFKLSHTCNSVVC